MILILMQMIIISIQNLGEIVELKSGKIGTIRFIGYVYFVKGNWFGIELHDNHFGPKQG